MERTSMDQDKATSGRVATMERRDQWQAGHGLRGEGNVMQGFSSKQDVGDTVIPVTILIVEEVESLRRSLQTTLEQAGFMVIPTQGAEQAIQAIEDKSVDLVLADVRLGGLSLFKKLKVDPCTTDIPVILMSDDWIEDANQAKDCEIGADDFLLMPFPDHLLVKTVRSVLGRYRGTAGPEERITVGELMVEPAKRTVTVRGTAVALTRKEFDLLLGFLHGRGRVFSHGSLLKTVWGYDPGRYHEAHTVKVHVSSLRTKLGQPGKRIVRVPGVGYKWAI